MTIRVLIADDSALMRRTLRRIVEADPDFEIVGFARDGEDAVQKARELRPDVVSMDINMPKLDGLTALQVIMHEAICPVVMVSSLTQAGAVTTFEALELGAFDYVAKPGTVTADMAAVAAELKGKLKQAASSGTLRRLQRPRRGFGGGEKAKPQAAPAATRGSAPGEMHAIAIGVSTGGPATLMEIVPLLPAGMNAAVFIVQHMPATFTSTFARRLDAAAQLPVHEAEAGMVVEAGHCYLARGDHHMTLFRRQNETLVLRTPRSPETLFIPSVNVMMESVLGMFGPKTVGVLLTGIGDDGASMMVKIRERGGYTVAESEETAVVYGMPREAAERGGADEVLPCYEIAAAVARRIPKLREVNAV